MKSRTIPPLRVFPSVESRKAQEAFIARGLATAARSRASRRYVSATRLLGTLRRRLAAARRRTRG